MCRLKSANRQAGQTYMPLVGILIPKFVEDSQDETSNFYVSFL